MGISERISAFLITVLTAVAIASVAASSIVVVVLKAVESPVSIAIGCIIALLIHALFVFKLRKNYLVHPTSVRKSCYAGSVLAVLLTLLFVLLEVF